jgi:hypothetical protein
VLSLEFFTRHLAELLYMLVKRLALLPSSWSQVGHKGHGLVFAVCGICARVDSPTHKGLSPRSAFEEVSAVYSSLSQPRASVPTKLVVEQMPSDDGSFIKFGSDLCNQGLQIRRKR